MVNNLKIKILTAVDLGMTEDEYNNMLIDWYVECKKKKSAIYQTLNLATGEITESDQPTTIKIQITGNPFK